MQVYKPRRRVKPDYAADLSVPILNRGQCAIETEIDNVSTTAMLFIFLWTTFVLVVHKILRHSYWNHQLKKLAEGKRFKVR